MKTRQLIFLFILGVLFSCSDEGDEGSIKKPSGGPAWTAGYPQVATGAVSLDLNLQTDGASRVYWIVANKALNLTAGEVINEATSSKNAAIKSHGVIEVTSNGDEQTKTVNSLTQNTKYFVYMVAQNKSDTLAQDNVESFQVTTHSRQDTLEYTSAAEGRKVKYLIYRPEAVLKYPDEKYPICFFLGGNGEVATDKLPVNMIRNGSLPEYIHKGNDVPMIVMSIQHTVKDWNTTLIDEGVDHGLATYPVDTKKVYMTGISGGGFGCWSYALDHPEKLTAIVPISGGGNKNKACNLKDLPIWAFHNETDPVVAASNSKDMVAAAKVCSKKEVKLQLFPDKGHDCWRRVFDKNHADWSKSPGIAKPNVYEWMLSKTK